MMNNDSLQEYRGRRGIGWWILFPLRLVITIIIVLFDALVSRFVIAGVVTGIFWVPLHFLFGLSGAYWKVPTLILGSMLLGLWEGCDMFPIRRFVPRSLRLIPDEIN